MDANRGNFRENNLKDIFERFSHGDSFTKAEILAEDIRRIAKKIKDDRKPSKHQIRKYYHYFRDIYEEIEDQHDFQQKLPKIALAKSYISCDRSRNNTEQTFKEFIENLVNSVLESKSMKTFEEMLILFEALVGYTS